MFDLKSHAWTVPWPNVKKNIWGFLDYKVSSKIFWCCIGNIEYFPCNYWTKEGCETIMSLNVTSNKITQYNFQEVSWMSSALWNFYKYKMTLNEEHHNFISQRVQKNMYGFVVGLKY